MLRHLERIGGGLEIRRGGTLRRSRSVVIRSGDRLHRRQQRSQNAYSVSPTRRSTSIKRGVVSQGIESGIPPTEGSQAERSKWALLSQAKACSLSPRTA